ncbi:MAG: heavy metal-associated domain-containing protein [Bacteroidota bacterium]
MKLTILLLISLVGFSFSSDINTEDENIKRAVIRTSALCEMCKSRIERTVNELDGIVSASLDLVSRKLRVRYDADIIQVTEIREAITAVGYKADEIPADQEAFDALPGCCRMEGACSSDG